MCNLFRYLCECCRMIYLYSTKLDATLSMCREYLREEGVCILKIYVVPKGLCRWCSVVCKKHYTKGVHFNIYNKLWECQQLLSEPKTFCFQPKGFFLRFSYEKHFSYYCYHPKEILRRHYFTEEDHFIARQFFEDVLIPNLFLNF